MSFGPRLAVALRSPFREDKQPEFKLDCYEEDDNIPLLRADQVQEQLAGECSSSQLRIAWCRRALPSFLSIVLITGILFGSACVYYETCTTLLLYLAILIVGFPLLTLWRFSTIWSHRLPRSVESSSTLFGSVIVRLHYLLAIIWFAAVVELIFFQPVISSINNAHQGIHQPRKQFNVFIASNLYNNEKILPSYSQSLKQLVHIIGADNAYVSIYESHSQDKTKVLLQQLDYDLSAMHVDRRILSDDRSIRQDIHSPGEDRIDFLAQVRNIAMEPLAANINASRPFTHVLWINDVLFDPHDAYNLLSTNNGDYDQVCAVDYIGNGFYDTWVTRDIDDNTLKRNWPYFMRSADIAALQSGTPFLVNSCWNGMTAFAAKWFVQQPSSSHPDATPLKFRSSPTCFSSECQLASYDIHRALSPLRPRIYINPSVQVAYRRAHYFMYNTLIPSPLSRVWRKVWRDWISYRLFGWLSESRRWSNPCKRVLTQWAAPDAPLAH